MRAEGLVCVGDLVPGVGDRCEKAAAPIDNCCIEGEACCGDGCIPVDDLPFTLCPVDGKCGCDGGKPAPIDCCTHDTVCCGNGCIEERLDPLGDCHEPGPVPCGCNTYPPPKY